MSFQVVSQYQGKDKHKEFPSEAEARCLGKLLQEAYNEACGEGVYMVFLMNSDTEIWSEDFDKQKIEL